NISRAKKILAGNVDEVVSELHKEMRLSSGRKLYEHALTRRNQIEALEGLKEKQVMELRRQVDAHIFNYVISEGKIYLLVFSIRKGILEGKQKFVFPYREGIFEEFVTQFYTTAQVPQLVIVPEKLDLSIKEYLEKLRGFRVELVNPNRGEKKK